VATALARELADEHDVAVAPDGRSALARIDAGEHFDAILCDVMMPEMTGSELHAALRATHPDQAERMIFVTGGAFTEKMLRFLDEVRLPRVDKPFDMARLRALLRERTGGGDGPRGLEPADPALSSPPRRRSDAR
jgi:CheY-like chemotaxis protein